MQPQSASPIAVVIPAYKPSAGLVDVVRSLAGASNHSIVIVDDGSGAGFRDIFERASEFPRVELLRHAVNLGKGAALKTAMNHVLCEMPQIIGIVTADADGQHHPEDILRVADALAKQPDALILGSREFGKDVPLRSKFGNVLTRSVMHALLGQKLTDTQTGLRGIPASFLPKLLRLETTGYEFELQMLIAAHELPIPIVEIPIRTIYEPGNTSSHFNPIVDSMKIYFVLLRFGSVSFMTALLDNLVYILVWRRTGNFLISQVLGRAVAVCFNYTMVRRSVFRSGQQHKQALPKYLLLVLASGTASYGAIRYLYENLDVDPIAAKIGVETFLFFVNFAVQRLFIFKPKDETNGARHTSAALVFPSLVAISFLGLVAVELNGLRAGTLWAQPIWFPVGLKRFTHYIGEFAALSVPILILVPWSYAGLLAGLLVVLTAVSVGVPAVLANALFFLSACALGSKLMGRGKRDSAVTHLSATLVGIGIYIVLMTLLARVPVHYAASWGALLAIPILIDFRGVIERLRYWASLVRGAGLRSFGERAATALLAFFLIAHWFVAMEPEKSSDGLAMHLAIPANIAANHALTFEPARILWSVMPMGADWAYSIVYLLGGEYASRLLNYGMLLILVALLYLAVRRWVPSAAALLLAASFTATPLVQFVTGSLFIENFLAAMIFGFVVAVWQFGATGERRYLFAAMLLGGAALNTKLGALAFLAVALPFVIFEIADRWKSLGRRPALTCALAAVLLLATAVPTYVIAYEKTGNPIFPFENQKHHSPLLDPTVDINDARYRIPVDWTILNHLTFHTNDAYEGQDGSFGFQYLVIVPLALIGLLVAGKRPALMAGIVAFGAAVLIQRSQPNVRYLYAGMPLITAAFAALLGWLATNQRWLYRSLLVYLAGVTALNAWFLPSASYYHKDFRMARPFSRAAHEQYLEEAAPVRKVIEYYNRHRSNSALLLTDDSTIAGIEGTVYENHWHQYPVVDQLRRAQNVTDMFRLMRRWNVEYFLGHKLFATHEELRPPALKALLLACTAPVYEFGDYYLSKLDPDCESRGAAPRPDAQPTITATPGFYDDFDPALVFRGDWSHDQHFSEPVGHSVSYTDVPGAEIAFAFQGKAFNYVFAKAPNRGIADVLVDGEQKARIDLYSPKIEWQSLQKFCCFGAGRHLAVIRVTGEHNPQATGRYVDVDAITVE